MGTGYRVLLLLHLICAIGGFGYLAYSGLILHLGRRRGATIGTLEVTQQVAGMAEILVYGTFLFGVAAVGASKRWGFGQAWVDVAMALYVAAIGVLHGLIRRNHKEYMRLARELSEATGPVVGTSVRRVESLEKRIAAGWGVFNILVVVILVMMVFRPGA